MVACDHMEKLNAKSRPHVTGTIVPSPRHGSRTSAISQRSELLASAVVSPTAQAAQNPLKIAISHAAFPSGSSRKSHDDNVQSGYPVGWGTPKCSAAVMNSPESSNVTFGAAVQA